MTQSDFQAMRVKMVDGQLRTTDVTSHDVLSAFLTVPRELFVGENRRELAYLDDDIEVAPGRYLMEPSPLAKLMQLAAIKSSDKVLVVGAATGYSAVAIANYAASVVALEGDEQLASAARINIAACNSKNIEFVLGEMSAGVPSKGPYDVIVIEGSVSRVPAALFDQLSDDGRLVAVVGTGLTGVANLYVKSARNTSASRGFNLAVKPLPGFQPVPQFSF